MGNTNKLELAQVLGRVEWRWFFCGKTGREVNVIFINKQFAALRLSNAKADKCQFFRELFNACADRTILLPWSPPRTCDPVAHFRRLNHG